MLKPALYPSDKFTAPQIRSRQTAAHPLETTACWTAVRRAYRLQWGIGPSRPAYKPLQDGPNVVWWDPSALTLEVEEHASLRHQRAYWRSIAAKTAANENNKTTRRGKRDGPILFDPGLAALDLRPDE